MNILDIVLLVFALAYALSGYRQGFIVGACATAGLLIGGVVGIWVAPMVLEGYDPSLLVSLAALCGVLLCATIGQTIAAYAGGALRRRVTWHPARAIDAVGGAVLSAAAALVVAWALGVAVSGAQIPAINREVSTSRVLSAVDAVLPGNADSVLDALNSVVDRSIFPRYLEPFVPERIISVDPPTRRVLRDPQVRRSSRSVVKILGTADSCARSSEGSGFVYAPGPRDDQRARRGRGRGPRRGHRRRELCRPRWSLRSRPRRRGARRRGPRLSSAAVLRNCGLGHVRGSPRLPADGPFHVEPPGSAASNGCAAPTSTARARSCARCSRCADGPPGQLRRAPGLARRPGPRRDLRGVGDRPAHRLRADRRPGPAPPRGSVAGRATASTPVRAAADRTRSAAREPFQQVMVNPSGPSSCGKCPTPGSGLAGPGHDRAPDPRGAAHGRGRVLRTGHGAAPAGRRRVASRAANRRPSVRSRERNSHRWYSSAQCGEGHSHIAAGTATAGSSGNRTVRMRARTAGASQEAAVRVREPAAPGARHLHREHVPPASDRPPRRSESAARRDAALTTAHNADISAGAAPRSPRRRTRPSRGRRSRRLRRRASFTTPETSWARVSGS